jgi:hypothetical protein
MAAEVEANGFIVGNTYSGRTRFSLRLGKVRHEEMIVFLWRGKKITEASGPCLCRYAPNRLSWSMKQRIVLLLTHAARRVVGLAAWVTKMRCRYAPNRLSWSMNQRIVLLLTHAARRSIVYVAALHTASASFTTVTFQRS